MKRVVAIYKFPKLQQNCLSYCRKGFKFDNYPATPSVYQAQHQDYPPPPYPTNSVPQSPVAVTTAPSQTVETVTGTSKPSYSLGNDSARMTCPHCHADINTRVIYSPSSNTHCCAIFLCCLFSPCAVFIPYCLSSCQEAHHVCPNCNMYLGYENENDYPNN